MSDAFRKKNSTTQTQTYIIEYIGCKKVFCKIFSNTKEILKTNMLYCCIITLEQYLFKFALAFIGKFFEN